MATGEFTLRDPGTHYVGDDETFMARLKTIPTKREDEDAANRYLKKLLTDQITPIRDLREPPEKDLQPIYAAYTKRVMSKLKNRK